MNPDIERWRSEDTIDFQGKYDAAIQSIGAVPFFAALFRKFEGSVLSAYLQAVTFTWQDLGFSEWREILRGIDDSTQAVYQFVWFAAQFLAIDVLAMIRTDPDPLDADRPL